MRCRVVVVPCAEDHEARVDDLRSVVTVDCGCETPSLGVGLPVEVCDFRVELDLLVDAVLGCCGFEIP